MTVTQVAEASRIRQALGALIGLNTPTVQMAPRKPWRKRLRNWLLRWSAYLAWTTVRAVVRQVARRWCAPWTAAAAAWAAATVAGQVADGWKMLAALGVVGAAPMGWWLGVPVGRWSRRRSLKPLEQRAWYAAFYVVLAVWSAVGAAWTTLPPWLGALVLPTFAVWVRWMWHHRVRHHDTPETLSTLDLAWQQVDGMAGTRLANVTEHANPKRWEADVDLTATKLIVKDVVGALPHIAKTFRAPQSSIIADYGPGRLEHVARLTVVEDNPCDAPIGYDESWIPTDTDIADGCVPFHLYPNGTRGRLRLWLSGAGTVNTLFSGDIRTGKSAGMETKMTQACMTGRVWPMAADPQGGVSMPTWCKRDGTGQAKWQATDLNDIYRQLCAFRDGMYARSAWMGEFRWVDKWGDEQVGINCWDPTIPGMPPAVAWACDEFWMLMLHDDFYEIYKEIMKMCNKTGMYLDIATQYPGIEEFHNDMAMRQPLTAGNLCAYRNTAGSVKNMILPSHLPSPFDIATETVTGEHTKGTLVCASQAPRSSLPVLSRSVWVERGRYWAEQAIQRVPELDTVTAGAFAKWMAPPSAQAPARGQNDTETPAAAPAPATRGVVTVKSVRVLDRIVAFLEKRDGQWAHTGVIAAALDVPKGTVGTTLKRAEAAGKVHQPKRGVWALGVAPAEQLELDEVAA